ncbi:Hsp70 family protein [Robbsia andropogonis]|uniref:Hsp70 family protein n=1 Tax=Robbsia andropogonis TaxID=28092 RepID=UPI000462FABF|nr:Hsp70 family protein [Robbsia andropogonis]MCP1121135.1 Hsp70 family protein [Robbsia andropogonis]MCP1130928.1 Hsp70 family protein [Robbsia andropogonis]
MTYCAIDFGTSNSALALAKPGAATSGGAFEAPRLIPLEGGNLTLPTAVFFNTDEHRHVFGRQAIAEYIDGYDGRLMRSLKSILGTHLADASTEIGDGASMPFTEIIGLFLRHLLQTAQREAGGPVTQAVMGRPVFFVDDDPKADAAAQSQLEAAARSVGLRDIVFQYEPIAAAFDYESTLDREEVVLVVDIGGGTSDFSLVRVGPDRVRQAARHDDVLGHFGVHVAGTDIDKRVALASVMRELGFQALDPSGREMPNRIYFDLSTWHLVNALYSPKRMAEFDQMKHLFIDPAHPTRLTRVLRNRLGHALIGLSEKAKIAVSNGGETMIDMSLVEPDLSVAFTETVMARAAAEDAARIVAAARETTRQAGVREADVAAVYFTGGSTGLRFLADAIATAFPNAHAVRGDPLASVAKGLGIHAQRMFAV